MTFEAIASVPGVVSTADVQNVPNEATSVLLLVLGRAGEPTRQSIAFGAIPGGRGVHRGLVCPLCSRPKYRLFTSSFGLGCGPCTARRTRRQLEYRTRAWRRLGGELEDVVLRGLRPGRRSSIVPEAIADAANALMVDDRERAALLLRRVDDAFKGAVTLDVDLIEAVAVEEP
ncbi:MAG: hypothetical protein KIT84_00585 [Labilithrix sp.]|nr:hypothetical protein [Labilithrix sp.]MCW5809480.1 hypothetical protein [Labilithrix sp.]